MAALPNKLAYITGSSKGIGKALTTKLLSNGYAVIGLSRTNDLVENNFQHIELDLSNLDAVQDFNFVQSANNVILINNAGIIGNIGPLGGIPNETIRAVINVNTIAPQLLMNNFFKRFNGHVDQGHIFNISSGAGKNPIDAWASYCSSKAAIDLFSDTIKTEWDLREVKNWHIHSIAPGVVDTNMQVAIRNASADSFKLLDKFIGLKKEGELADPNFTAEQLFKVIKEPHNYPKPIISVRDF